MDGESVSCEPILTSSAGCDSGDVQLLQDIIDANGLDEEFSENDVDDGDGEFEPLELGGQKWEDGRLVWLNLWAEDSGFYYYISEIPNSISNLTELTYLDLDNNNVSDLPPSFGELQSLRLLALGDNPIVPIPEEIWLLTGLTNLFLYKLDSDSELTQLPDGIQNLTNLEGLYLHGNALSAIPEGISSLVNQKHLWLSENQLLDGIPAWIGGLTNLKRLELGNNQLTGTIPSEIGNLTNLIYLYLYNNEITGEIPTEISNLTNLTYLKLYSNQLTGAMSESICNLNLDWSDSYYFNISNNQLCPPYPACIDDNVGEQDYGQVSIREKIHPINYNLSNPYPNPFNPVATLLYDLPEDALVNITVYDMMGRQVKTLIDDQQTAGYRSTQWNATNDAGSPVSAGIYLYMIQAGDFRQTKKMVLLK